MQHDPLGFIFWKWSFWRHRTICSLSEDRWHCQSRSRTSRPHPTATTTQDDTSQPHITVWIQWQSPAAINIQPDKGSYSQRVSSVQHVPLSRTHVVRQPLEYSLSQQSTGDSSPQIYLARMRKLAHLITTWLTGFMTQQQSTLGYITISQAKY